MSFDIEWRDYGREPQHPSNPAYPLGIDLDAAAGTEHACKESLPYPARRCGVYVVTCNLCMLRVGITTAGRPDDPRSIRLPCRFEGEA